MSGKEQPQPDQPFAFTERERLFDQLSHARFQALLNDRDTIIHEVEMSSNSFGEFLFVTVSRPGAEQRTYYTCYGLGYHDYRERWITGAWSWFESSRIYTLETQQVTREEAEQIIAERKAEIQPHLDKYTQSPRGRLYEFLAEITDEDGAISELEDLGDAADWLFGEDDDIE